MLASALVAMVSLLAPSGVGDCWPPPVVAPVVDPFRAPACVWCPGNRGLEYATIQGDAVRASAPGVVTFAGSVAGILYVTVETADTALVTYGRLASVRVGEGDRVVTGQLVGRAGPSLIFTVRRDGAYVDPAPLLGRWQRRARLVPTDGSAARPQPPPRLTCEPSRPGR